jgi:hypothetical protein
MKRNISVLAALAGLALAGTTHAQHALQTTEEALESEPSLVMLPSAGIGSLTAKQCRDCEDIQLTMDASAQLIINGQPVTFADFQDAAIRSRNASLIVLYRVEDRQVTQLRLAN